MRHSSGTPVLSNKYTPLIICGGVTLSCPEYFQELCRLNMLSSSSYIIIIMLHHYKIYIANCNNNNSEENGIQ
jgi:hypothetical protein